MIKKSMWYVIVIIAFIGFIVLSVGFYKAIMLTSGSISKSIPDKADTNKTKISRQTNIIDILIMGDSIAKGTGDEMGKGFSDYLPESLKNKTHKDISIQNVGTDGLRSEGMLTQLQNGKLDSLIGKTDFILISIGGNDIRTIQNLEVSAKDQSFNELQVKYLSDLKESINIIRKSNKNTMIVFLGLYNPYRTTGSFEDDRLVNIWNSSTQQLLEADDRSLFIPTDDLIKFNIEKYIAADGLHPNSSGYQAISGRIAEAVEGLLN